MNTVELFAGIGGFRLASDRTGLQTIWANDVSAKACTVYKDRFGDSELQEGELADSEKGIPAHDVLTAGYPCQPFSSAGKKEGIRDVRGTLFEHIVDILKRHRPKFFVLENVKRLLTMERGWHFATILEALAQLDYAVEWRLLNAMHFGLPQNRERIFIVGQKVSDGWPNSCTEEDTSPVRLAVANDFSCLDNEGRYLQMLWIGFSGHAATFSSAPSTSSPFLNSAPALTNATR
jgi:DNA (cytosine-5)-methyltransferase 1